MNQADIIDVERPFDLAELFFSTTDARGIVTDGNDVFCRISGYELEELLGKPHSIVRHPEMPRVVFQLLWETIQSGNPIAAYVKNRAKAGEHYWVMALAMPTDCGYVSIRLKPSSPLLQTVAPLYSELRQAEHQIECEPKKRKEAMEASRSLLLRRLSQLGFPRYQDFMMHALSKEMMSRAEQLVQKRHVIGNQAIGQGNLLRTLLEIDQFLTNAFKNIKSFQDLGTILTSGATSIANAAENIHLQSLNATIASRKGDSSYAPLQALSSELGSASKQTCVVSEELSNQMKSALNKLDEAVFLLSATKLISETMLQFVRTINHDSILVHRTANSIAVLKLQLQKTSNLLLPAIRSIAETVSRTEGQVHELEFQAGRLRFVQFAGLKEASYVPMEKFFTQTFVDVRKMIDAIMGDCGKVKTACRTAVRSVKDLLEIVPKLQKYFVRLETSDGPTKILSPNVSPSFSSQSNVPMHFT